MLSGTRSHPRPYPCRHWSRRGWWRWSLQPPSRHRPLRGPPRWGRDGSWTFDDDIGPRRFPKPWTTTENEWTGPEGGSGTAAEYRRVVCRIHRGHLEGSSGMCSNPHLRPRVRCLGESLEQDAPIARCPLPEDCEETGHGHEAR